ncbi:hypothetical protein GQ43DRAFT_494389 [Delitschia confertaspora ATCC 74209]|uniref:R3H domain protein n=1 Tax=Delitschia confertaspora ATCC 74209 TaxID=1513339 RepID=A0A9P4MSJ3_9PLEO|nr:hypothetical protein GQ43DRAFT_494389 [Delitschia confertaspora ATCC 74209]
MASTTSMPIEQTQVKPSFAKVAASAYKPQILNQTPSNHNPQAMSAPLSNHLQDSSRSSPSENGAPSVCSEITTDDGPKDNAGSIAARTGQWANSTGQQVAFEPGSKESESEKTGPAINLVKPPAQEDSTTQLSSSDGSAKPPSLDGKSVASGTTFALDEKESIRPDDSASLRAVEEEDVASPPGSVVAGSRVGSDSGVARAFRDQLHEIAVMGGPAAQRGAPPGRFPNPHVNSSHALYDPNQPRPMSQPPVIGMPNALGSHNLPAVPDEKLIEALESPRDRLFVLKLEQDFIDFVKDSNENELSLPNCNTFYRMLAHRLADYYLLGHVVDTTMTGVKITRTPYCRIPPPLSGIPTLAKNANTPPVDMPARKIMRRGDDPKSGTSTTANSEGPSKTTSEAGGGSDGGNDSETKDKATLTREEREARYREARQRIFGHTESQEGESADTGASGEEKDISRSSSAAGKKKPKKQRNYDDDGFEARSRYNVYYPPQYAVAAYNSDNSAIYYGGYPNAMQTTNYPGVAPNMSPPSAFSPAYPAMMSQDPQAQYGWAGSQYPSTNGSVGYPAYGGTSNGYDLSADFQRGMQSFQTAGVPTQSTPKMANPPMASYPEQYQPQNMGGMNPAWSPMGPQPIYPTVSPQYAQSGSGSRPTTAPHQGLAPAYGYSQFSGSTFNNGLSSGNQHSMPGNYSRPQFNPQSQAFIPGGRNAPFQMQPNMAQMQAQGINSYGNMSMQMTGQPQNPMGRQNSAIPHPQSFGSPRGSPNNHPVPAKVNNLSASQPAPPASTQPMTASAMSGQPNSSSMPVQSSIAKWGTPSHLPPKPPPPAQAQAPKFSLPTHNFAPGSRIGNGIAPGYPTTGPMLRGGSMSNGQQ